MTTNTWSGDAGPSGATKAHIKFIRNRRIKKKAARSTRSTTPPISIHSQPLSNECERSVNQLPVRHILVHLSSLFFSVLLLAEFTADVLLFGGGVLVLLVFTYEIIQVGLGLGEFHLVHTLAGVPVKEGLATEHHGELLGNALPCLLDGGGITNKDGAHLHAHGGDVTDGRLEVVGDPLNKVAGVLVVHLDHLIVDLLGGDLPAVHHGAGEVASVAGIGGAHHVLGIKGLLGEFRDGEDAVVLAGTGGEGGEANEEEVKTGEGDHVDGELAEVAVQLTGETEGAGGSGNGAGD